MEIQYGRFGIDCDTPRMGESTLYLWNGEWRVVAVFDNNDATDLVYALKDAFDVD